MIQKFLAKDKEGNWNMIPPLSDDESRKVNCHKFALYILGLISRDELLSDSKAQKETNSNFDFTFGKKALAISDKKFTPIADAESLEKFTEENCKVGKMYMGQILDAETGEMAHSFFVEKLSAGTLKCFDKAGFKKTFGVYELKDLFAFENYHNQKWRFVSVESIK